MLLVSTVIVGISGFVKVRPVPAKAGGADVQTQAQPTSTDETPTSDKTSETDE